MIETMARNTEHTNGKHGNRWRLVAWTAAALLLLAPLVAMQFTDEVAWSLGDFVIMGALLVSVGGAYELAIRMTSNTAYRVAIGLALLATFLLVWVNGAVGIIGSENNDANLMYGGVLVVAFVGAVLARFHPQGMARAMFATALALVIVAMIAVVAGLGEPWSNSQEIILLNGFFIALFVGSGFLFREAATGAVEQETAP